MNIIIVDDNSLVRRTIRDIIEDEGDSILEFSCGEDVIKLLKNREFEPDWILLDIKMKGINGFETASEIKKINPDWNIGFITNYDLSSYRKRAKEAGGNFFISKNDLIRIREKIKQK